MVNILVVFYSMTGNVAKLKDSIVEGIEDEGAKVRIRQVKELIPEDRWDDRMKKVKEELKDIPFAEISDLEWADGIAIGSPTRYGNLSAQMKMFLDGTGELWVKGSLVGKVATIFTSASTQHGGHETTVLSTIPVLMHHGMLVMGVPYTIPETRQMEDIGGGGPYGASSVSGPKADRGPIEQDKKIAFEQGKRLAKIAKKLSGS